MAQLDPNKIKKQEEKTKTATKIAHRANKVSSNYYEVEAGVIKFFRFISSFVDKFLFSKKYALISSLILSIVIVLSLNVGGYRWIAQYQSVETMENFPVTVNANEEVFEYSGIPETISVQLIGELADLQVNSASDTLSVLADLSNLSEGIHVIPLRAVNYPSNLEVKMEPSSITVNVARKVSRQYTIGYEFINTDKADLIYSYGVPELSTTQVVVRASEETLNSIASVKALVDVSGTTKSFSIDAPLVAYNQQGNKIDVDIVPATVTATVAVTSPSKDVPIIITPVGTLPEGKSIESITLDHQAVTIYAPDSVLESIENITIPVDVNNVTGDTESVVSIALPSGVRKSNITRVNFTIKLGDTVTKTIDGVKIFANNLDQNKYSYSLANAGDTEIDITISGTQTNINKVDVNSLQANVDFSTVSVGKFSLPIVVTGNNPLVVYTPVKANLDIEVIEN